MTCVPGKIKDNVPKRIINKYVKRITELGESGSLLQYTNNRSTTFFFVNVKFETKK